MVSPLGGVLGQLQEAGLAGKVRVVDMDHLPDLDVEPAELAGDGAQLLWSVKGAPAIGALDGFQGHGDSFLGGLKTGSRERPQPDIRGQVRQ